MNTINKKSKMPIIFISGAAGLVGQNLIPRLKQSFDIIAVDKHPHNSEVLQRLHPEIKVMQADISTSGDWEKALRGSDYAIMLHAQIGGLNEAEFIANNITATENMLRVMTDMNMKYFVHVSSSVINSMADDFYTQTKTQQERLVGLSAIPHVVLRPTLMFGWFDRKHLGWLRRFMEAVLVFPIPGNGKYLRQPLYAGDFAKIISSCINKYIEGSYNISGRESINYIDLIVEIKKTVDAKALILKIPYSVFWFLLKVYAVFDRNPPFTTSQLKALATPDVFEVIDWPEIFGISETPLNQALGDTFLHPEYSEILLEF